MKRFPLIAFAMVLGSCLFETETTLPEYKPLLFFEDFQYENVENFTNSSWESISTQGSRMWTFKTFSNNGYVEFSAYNSEENTNEAWLISPEIELNPSKEYFLTFKTAQHHLVDTTQNGIHLYIVPSVEQDLQQISVKEIPFNKPLPEDANYQWKASGIISIKNHTGKIKIAFKATGGTSSTMSGAYMIDELKLF
ncbi:choice-of-anchor J domain-containing protein [Capnocytophaga sp. ARDL2]|uniref:choice-of-anchor J domain-containing protein n=1 Tax=Capnocytophaga sp. ARDL2 TaxID=3238809 RepID=UPI0035568CAD